MGEYVHFTVVIERRFNSSGGVSLTFRIDFSLKLIPKPKFNPTLKSILKLILSILGLILAFSETPPRTMIAFYITFHIDIITFRDRTIPKRRKGCVLSYDSSICSITIGPTCRVNKTAILIMILSDVIMKSMILRKGRIIN